MAFDPGEDSIWPDWWRPAVMAELLELTPACAQDVWGWIQSGLCPRASSPDRPELPKVLLLPNSFQVRRASQTATGLLLAPLQNFTLYAKFLSLSL